LVEPLLVLLCRHLLVRYLLCRGRASWGDRERVVLSFKDSYRASREDSKRDWITYEV
jgi:hypothetical protein